MRDLQICDDHAGFWSRQVLALVVGFKLVDASLINETQRGHASKETSWCNELVMSPEIFASADTRRTKDDGIGIRQSV